jgi:aspartate aminotransferase
MADIRFAPRAESLLGSATLQITAKAAELRASGHDVVSLSAGQPDFPSPRAAIEAAEKAMREGRTGYTANAGLPELRKAVAEKWGNLRGICPDPSRVLVSCGAKHSIANLMEAVVREGDKVLIPRPWWVSYPEMVKRLGGIPVAGSGTHLTADDVREAAAAGATGMIFNSPDNPGGRVYSRGEIQEIADAAADAGFWVISDDIYEFLHYGDEPVPHLLDARPDLAPRLAVVTGVSKTWSMTGWRIGFALADPAWIALAGRVQSHTTSNAPTMCQYGALAVVQGLAEGERIEMLHAFRARRDLMCSMLAGAEGLSFQEPRGAFYVFVRIETGPGALDSSGFCISLLEQEGVAVIPGDAFGSEGFIRLSFAASNSDIEKGVKRLRAFLSGRV